MINPIDVQEVRIKILELLYKRPMRSEMISNRIKNASWGLIEDVLRDLVREMVIVPRSKYFYLRNRAATWAELNPKQTAKS